MGQGTDHKDGTRRYLTAAERRKYSADWDAVWVWEAASQTWRLERHPPTFTGRRSTPQERAAAAETLAALAGVLAATRAEE